VYGAGCYSEARTSPHLLHCTVAELYTFSVLLFVLLFQQFNKIFHTCFVSGLAYLCPVHTKNPSSYVGSRKYGWGQNFMNRNCIE